MGQRAQRLSESERHWQAGPHVDEAIVAADDGFPVDAEPEGPADEDAGSAEDEEAAGALEVDDPVDEAAGVPEVSGVDDGGRDAEAALEDAEGTAEEGPADADEDAAETLDAGVSVDEEVGGPELSCAEDGAWDADVAPEDDPGTADDEAADEDETNPEDDDAVDVLPDDEEAAAPDAEDAVDALPDDEEVPPSSRSMMVKQPLANQAVAATDNARVRKE